ncbi:MAG: thiamine pyrophosphate-dependent enzyme [bacterium]|nr:thiamine pyrophosphate-dependent enzyme [bacterium]
MIERMDVFRALAARRTEEIVVITMSATRQWPLVSKSDLDFDFLAFGMGHAGDFALGLALARPERKTIVLKGDGGQLMSLGSLVTKGAYAPGNLLVLFLENRTYETTGGQPFSERVDFEKIARGAGIAGGGATGKGKVERIETLAAFEAALPRLLTEEGPHFVILPVENNEEVPKISHSNHAGRIRRLRKALGLETTA